MTLPASGQITMAQVNTELGRAATTNSSLGEAAVRGLAGIPSGMIAMSNLHGKSSGQPPTIAIASYVNSNNDTVTLSLTGSAPVTVSGAWVVGGGANIAVDKNSETDWSFAPTSTGTFTGTYRFTASNAYGSASVDQAISVFDST